MDKSQQQRADNGRAQLHRGRIGDVEFRFREPTWHDAEVYGAAVRRNPVVANRQLFSAVLDSAERQQVLASLRGAPFAIGRFVDEVLSPFLGGDLVVESEPIPT